MKQPWNVPLAMKHVQDLHAWFRNPINDDILANHETSRALAEVVAAAPKTRILSQYSEAGYEQIDEPVSRSLVVLGDVTPDFNQIAASSQREPLCLHPSGAGRPSGRAERPASGLQFLREFRESGIGVIAKAARFEIG
jgi:hypothetical protein